jgi:alpha-mannosidase
MSYWSPPRDTKPTFDEAVKHFGENGDARELRKAHVFGPSWSNHWVKIDITIPKELREDEQVICTSFPPISKSCTKRSPLTLDL